MISVIMTLHNRAHLLQWALLDGIMRQEWVRRPCGKNIEIIVLDDGSTDNLDHILRVASIDLVEPVRKWTWDRKETNIKFNCPAIPYNILVKLARGDTIIKMDPEMVLLDPEFMDKSLAILDNNPRAIVMPFPYHCREFQISEFYDIEDYYMKYHYQTHITKENAYETMVYYVAAFRKQAYIDLGGIEEDFSSGIGSEDDHFLSWWKREYGTDSFITLLDSPAVHLYHGGMAESPDKGVVGVPPQLYPWVEQNVQLKERIVNRKPNEGRDWGKFYDSMKLTAWSHGDKVVNNISVWDMLKVPSFEEVLTKATDKNCGKQSRVYDIRKIGEVIKWIDEMDHMLREDKT